MINSYDMFIVKVALSMQDEDEEERQLENIDKSIEKVRPKTYKDQQIEYIAGKQLTGGQLARGAGIGAGVGISSSLLRGAIEEGKKGVAGYVKNPRKMLASAVGGSLIGGALPALRRYMDVKSAEGGWY